MLCEVFCYLQQHQQHVANAGMLGLILHGFGTHTPDYVCTQTQQQLCAAV